MLVKEIVYEILDEIKANSDDAFFTEDHVIFLIKKYRSFLIKKEQDKEKNTTDVASEFEYQQICLDLEKVEAIPGLHCEGGYYLRTTEAIPKILEGTQPKVYPSDFYGNINVVFVSRDRMRYVGTNRYLQNIIYTSIGPDLHLYMKSSNPQFLYLEGDNKLRMTAIFEDFDAASELLCDAEGNSTPCDVLDSTFPIRDYLVPPLIELVVKELIGANYRPMDEVNNAKDNNAGLTVKN
jgi:hypothetical protein